MLNDTIQSFRVLKKELSVDDNTAAILLLAEAVKETVWDKNKFDQFGHELCLGIRHGISEFGDAVTMHGSGIADSVNNVSNTIDRS